MYFGEFSKTITHGVLILKLMFRVLVTDNLEVIIEGVHEWIGPGSPDYVKSSDNEEGK